ncbi:unnamed protein product [Linum trigynum]|uniref:Uncharacterized protein n=1 Tax=Linum trigynum TaxID=586398 RepID=A0AAV2F607_9ROSI
MGAMLLGRWMLLHCSPFLNLSPKLPKYCWWEILDMVMNRPTSSFPHSPYKKDNISYFYYGQVHRKEEVVPCNIGFIPAKVLRLISRFAIRHSALAILQEKKKWEKDSSSSEQMGQVELDTKVLENKTVCNGKKPRTALQIEF